MSKFKKMLLASLPFVGFGALAEGTGYTVPEGVTTALTDARSAATALANAAIPAVAAIALAFVGICVIWLVVKAIRRGAK